MTIKEAKQFFSKSLKGVVRGHVQVGRYEYEYRQWDGEQCGSKLLGFDTETEVIEDPAKVPRLALAQVFDGYTVYLVHPSTLAPFIRRHGDAVFVMHNVAFDWHVVYRHLLRSRGRDAAREWLRTVDDARVTDTMLMDQLLRIGYGSRNPVQRDLSKLADQYLGFVHVDKDDPWRLRYGEILDVPWSTVDREAWEYAARDAVVTRDVFKVLRTRTRRFVREQKVPESIIDQFSPLTIRVQVRAAIALRQIELNGIRIDESRRDESQKDLGKSINELVGKLDVIEDFHGIFKRDKDGELSLSPTGKPRTNQKQLREVLKRVADEHELDAPKTSKGEVSLAREFWQDHVELEPFIGLWIDLEKTAKLVQFFGKLQSNKVHPGYTTLVRTGRTSCKSPNIQQIPKQSTFRHMFIPRPGHVFLIIDYSALELRTLAAVCEDRFGYSILAETIRSGRDPHCYVASLLSEIEYGEFVQLKQENPSTYKQRRQAAKACSFGIPGGLGPEALAQYARMNYGVDMSEDEAAQFRVRFLEEIFPEIGEYMESDTANVLAGNLQCKGRDVHRLFKTDGTLGAVKRIVSGKPYKRNGEEYEIAFVDRCWDSLRELNRNDRLIDDLDDELAGDNLERRLFRGTVIAPGGFVRGRTTFTQSRNTPFQSAASTGGKIAAWQLFRQGFRVVAFVHDEFVLELPEDCDYTAEAERINQICCDSMQQVTGAVPIECEYAMSICWSKQAEAVWESGKLQVWTGS